MFFFNYDKFKKINETYVNLFGEDIADYSEELYDMVQKSYATMGGIKGRGFESPEDMVENIKMVKFSRKNGEIKAVIFYKDKAEDGRKTVAVSTDFTEEGKEELKKMLKQEFKRSYIEVSGALLRFIEKNFPEEFEKYKIKNDTNLSIFKDINRIDDYYYERKIGDEMIKKIAIGTPNVEFY
jgi:hypothetical protein